MTEEFVLLECVTDNPYQPRTIDNIEHIENLARSIAADGLLQKPTARHGLGSAELAFGHSRRKAFEWLRMNWEKEGLRERYNNYTQMPLNFEDLTDEEMYRFAVSENVQRKDLDAIEIAKSMIVYRDTFGRNSDEIGALFGMNGSTVRGKLRLLDLPEQVQEKLTSGEVSEGLARALLSLQKLSSPTDLLEALEEVKENPEDAPTYVVERFVSNMDHVEAMWCDNRGGKPKSHWGDRGWLLDMKKFPNHLLPTLDSAVIIKALRVEGDKVAVNLIEGWVNTIGASLENLNAANVLALGEITPEYVSKLAVLINPPACNVCPFYTKMDGSHYCGMKVCHQRKSAAWAAHRFEKMSKDMGIAVYQPEDGKYRLLDTYNEKSLFAKKNKDLRLLPKDQWGGHAYQSFDGFDSELAWMVITGETLKKRTEEKKTERAEEQNNEDEVEGILERAEEALTWAAAAEVARQLFEGFNEAAIDLLFHGSYGWRRISFLKGQEPTEEHAQQVLWIARAMLDFDEDDDFQNFETAAQIVEALTKTCKGLSVKLPKALGKMAAEFDAQLAAVAVETKKKK